jgi:hypothetical protein
MDITRINLKNTVLRDQAIWLTPVIPATSEVEIGKIMVQGLPREKGRPPSQKARCAGSACDPSYAGGIGGSLVRLAPEKMVDCYSKNN